MLFDLGESTRPREIRTAPDRNGAPNEAEAKVWAVTIVGHQTIMLPDTPAWERFWYQIRFVDGEWSAWTSVRGNPG